MENIEERAVFPLSQSSTPRQRRRWWLLPGGVALVLALTLGTVLVASQALAAGPVASGNSVIRRLPTATPGNLPGQCNGQLTVSSVTNRTITVTGPNGNTSTVYVNSHTQYVRGGQVVAASAVTVGSHIYVVGACGQGKVIRATRIEIVG